MMRFIISLIFFTILIPSLCFTQQDPSFIEIPYKNIEVKLDGILDEWDKKFDFFFEDTLKSLHSPPGINISKVYPANFDFSLIKTPLSKNRVSIKWFWNYTNLCFAFVVYDKHLNAQAINETNKPHHHFNDGIEIYIDSKNDSKNRMDINDYQFIIDLLNNVDIFRGERKFFQSDTFAVPKDYGQNILIKNFSKVYGTINDSTDIDEYYVIEVVIPFTSLGIEPKTGMKMKFDLCCNDVDFPLNQAIINDYASTNTWPFSWSGYSDFGYPQYWKNVQLVGEPGFLEEINQRLSSKWLILYTITLLISLVFIIILLIKFNKLRRLPRKDEILQSSFIFSTGVYDKELSFNQKILQKAKDFIILNKDKQVTSEEVAKNIGISLRTFQRLVKEELNCTPTNFITIIKLNLAADYLSKKIGNVTDAAYEFGFSNPSYFSKQFHKHFGISPSEFMKKNDKSMN